jgi:hypothetical protein
VNNLKTYIIFLNLLFLSFYSYADTIPFNDSVPFNNIEQHIDYKRLGFHTGIFVGMGGVMMVVLEALPENATAWNKEEIRGVPLFKRWGNHVKSGPVIDKDRVAFNYILHPYAGAVYYQAARGSGCNVWQSFLYCTFVSNVLWEYGFEAFNEIPSIQDLIITPVVGSAIGEGFYYAKRKIVSRNYNVLGKRWIGKTICWVIDPFNEFANIFLNKKDCVTSSFLITKNQRLLTVNITL